MSSPQTWQLAWQGWPDGPQPFAAPGLAAANEWLQQFAAEGKLAVLAQNHPALPAIIQAALNNELQLQLVPPHLGEQIRCLPVPNLAAPPAALTECPPPTQLRQSTGSLQLFSSASSGPAKVIELSAEQCWRGAERCRDWLGLGPDDTFVCCLGLDHLGGLSQVLRACLCGYQLTLCERFDVDHIAQLWPKHQRH